MNSQPYRVEVGEIEAMRDMYRYEMQCQIIHDSIHSRPGWTEEYMLTCGGALAGYGSVAVSGPWKEKPTLYEFYVLPRYRGHLFDLFLAWRDASGATRIETQSNDNLLTVMLHAFAQDVTSESILFQDEFATGHPPPDAAATFRRAKPEDLEQMNLHQLDPDAKWLVAVPGAIAAAGDILFHYNRPYGDIYMKVAEPFRGRGFGTYLVQELKRVCYQGGSVPAARCNPKNTASRKTLQKTGFVPCGHILNGTIKL